MIHPTIVLWSAIAISLVLGVVLTGWVRRYALARSIIDVPNHRSSHTVATPRGGGMAIVLCYVAGIVALWVLGLLPLHIAMALLGAVAIALVGWRDDHGELSPLVRLIVQLAASVWAVAWLHGFPVISLGHSTAHVGLWGSALAVLALVWLTNLYNFMDGIDGIAGSEAVLVGSAIAVILWRAGAPGLAIASAVLAAAALGFLFWNWPPARIFMGDVGSGTVGFAFGTIALSAQRTAAVPALILLLPLGVFIGDATFTVVRRALRRERLYAAHRSHIYQQLVQLGWEHERVTTAVSVLTLGVSALAGIALLYPALAAASILGAIVLLVASGWVLVRVASRGVVTDERPMEARVARSDARHVSANMMNSSQNETFSATETAAPTPDGVPVSAPPDDDGGDLTVMMRRQA
ncbi:MAG TPA: glycosyltransferase family 4 protein [Gemmatimonadaceae bacterium]